MSGQQARRTRLKADTVGGLFWVAGGLWIAWEGRELGLGTLRDPGSGLILFWVGLAMAAMSAVTLVTGFLARPAAAGEWADWHGLEWRKLAVVLATMIVYAGALEPVGFIPATLVLMAVLFRAVEPQPWHVVLLGALITTTVVYVVFKLGLGTQLPDGLLGAG
ncbi:MAG: tripartite tricarboxylate transporter TctB family protein [Alphaproteobacteria bacterium]|nr:tripartite tricarboxylate transporter TctB family protein [Alphaproteobacteria bacterium]